MPDRPSQEHLQPTYPDRVFIDNPAGEATKNLYNEKTLEYLRSVEVAAAYPYPYGFFLDTTSGDGDNLDCFVITDQPIDQAAIVEVEPLGVMEVIDSGEADHKIIARLKGETQEITEAVKHKLSQFILEVFAHLPDKHMEIGEFLPAAAAVEMIIAAQDDPATQAPDNAHYDTV